LVGELTGWNAPVGGGDPVYLTSEQTELLAAEGVRLLTSFLPGKVAKRVISAVSEIPRQTAGKSMKLRSLAENVSKRSNVK
jgi:hypothetical protein